MGDLFTALPPNDPRKLQAEARRGKPSRAGKAVSASRKPMVEAWQLHAAVRQRPVRVPWERRSPSGRGGLRLDLPTWEQQRTEHQSNDRRGR